MGKNERVKKILLIAMFAALLINLSAGFSFALEIDYPRLPGTVPPQDFASSSPQEALPLYVQYLFTAAIIVIGIVFFASLFVAGYEFLTARGNPSKIISARDRLSSAFIGILILLASWLILNSISPRLTNFNLPDLAQIQTTAKPEEIPLPGGALRSWIETEIPLGKIIEEKILETKEIKKEKNKTSGEESSWEKENQENQMTEEEKKQARMERLSDIASNFLELSKQIQKQSEELKNESGKCQCGETQPCCEAVLDGVNPAESCPDNTCTSKPGCTCDPCKNERAKIQELEKKNFDALYLGTKILTKNSSGNDKEIETSIREEQRKAKREIKLLNEEIGKLENAEKFMINCPLWSLKNLAKFLSIKSEYEAKQWVVSSARFWQNITVDNDWASFFCPVSGTTWAGNAGDNTVSSAETTSGAIASAPTTGLACTKEIPLGETIDRTERIGYKLLERTAKLVSLSEELTKATEELHVLISQCSSRGPSSDPQRGGCFSVCVPSLFTCVKHCEGQPCPTAAIAKKIQDIKNIIEGIPNGEKPEGKKDKEGIKDVVNANKKTKESDIEDSEAREQIGIKTIIESAVPKIINDLEGEVREPMKRCLIGETQGSEAMDCKSAVSNIGPNDELIKTCCYKEKPYTNCLSQCYLENGNTDYKKCLKKCLEKEAEKNKTEDIKTCLHVINFYCCTP